MPDASTTIAVIVALFALCLTVIRYRRNRDLGMARGDSLGRAMWHDRMLNRNQR